MADDLEGTGIEQTPTYALAVVAFVFVLISLIAERSIHRLKKYLKKHKQKPLRKVLDKMTEELMLLGFISLLLTVLQTPLSHICVTPNFAKHFLPCSKTEYTDGAFAPGVAEVSTFGRKLMNYYHISVDPWDMGPKRRVMAEETGSGYCSAKGKVPFVSVEVLHQLHIFVFVLAVTHVGYSCVTVGLGFARLNNWRRWEEETRRVGYDGNKDLHQCYCKKILCEKPPLIGVSGHAHAFVDRHANHWCYENPLSLWVLCFFQQFIASVSREDYLTFRVGFLNNHNLGDSFNFRDYVIRSMEVDFKKVIGISWWLWLFAVVFLLLNVRGWYTYFWAAFVPTIMVLIIGTKQQHIISTLALQAKRHAAKILADEADGRIPRSQTSLIDVAKAVSPSDKLFWFDNPKFLLKLLHFVIFQNSFELAIFFWFLTSLGWNSCIMGNHTLLIIRLVTGITTQIMASYSTLPVYALVTQMGTQLKETVFTKDVFDGLKAWRVKAGRNRDKRSTTASNSAENSVVSPNGSSKGGSQSGSLGRSNEGSWGFRLPSLPREGAVVVNDSTDADPTDEVAKKCRLMFGKEDGRERLRAAKICASSRHHRSSLRVEEEEVNQID